MRLINCYKIIIILALAFLPTVICADYIYWNSVSFGPIQLASIANQSDIFEGSATITLSTSANAEITADNTTDAQLHSLTDTLNTEYKLSFDGNGESSTGGTNTSYQTYDSFLFASAAAITYVADDNDVQVTLYVRASNYSDDVSDSGAYTATQTLTATWVGP